MNTDRKDQGPGGVPDELDERALERLFAQAADEAPPALDDAFRARLLDDAAAAQPRPAPAGFWSRLVEWIGELGGVPGLAGVAAAGVAGVWIGFSGQGVGGDLASQFWQGAATVSPTVSGWVEEGPLAVAGSDLLSLMEEAE